MVDLRLDRIFDPKSIALIGASDKEGTVGHILMRNLTSLGFGGSVYPVNVHKDNILGLKAYQTIDQLPEPVDLAIIATPARTVPEILEQCGKNGTTGIIIISAGFKEIGPEGKALEDNISEIRRKYNLRIIGPNCLGIIRPNIHLNATFTNRLPKDGTIAFISQSGALGSAILDLAIQQNIGLSSFVSVGSMNDVDFGDLIDYFGGDPETKSILIYIEGITKARKFLSAARHFAKSKPIIVVKSGRFKESAKAAASHTGSLAGEDVIYEAAFKRAGLVRVDEIADLFSSAEVLGMQPLPKGPNLAIITNAGGPGVMATDALISRGGKLAILSEGTIRNLNNILPSYWSHGNPVDILGDSGADRYKAVIEACLDDENIDGLLIIYTGQAIGDPVEVAEGVAKVCKSQRSKTVMTSFLGGKTMEEANRILAHSSLPTFSTPEQAVKTFVYMYQYKRNLELLYETPEEVPSDIASPRHPLLVMLKNAALEKRDTLTEEEAKTILAYCSIPVVETQVAPTAEEAVRIASKIGYPVALKILSPQITHKTDAGGIALDIASETEVVEAFDHIVKQAKKYNPEAEILGITVQPMIKRKGHEIIIGAKKDLIFGPVILFGMGGIGVELLKDFAIGFPPLNRTLARRTMEETKVYRLLNGYRNVPTANLRLLEEILVRFSQMLIDFPQLKEVDINPLFVDETEAFALDARVVIDKELALAGIKSHEHLLIPPYPQKYEDICRLRDGREALLRPIKPEDEPLWLEMFQSLSEETKRHRFFQITRDAPDNVRVRYCNIDYDREIIVVAESAEEKQRKILAAVGLVIEPYEKTGEISLIVADQWQGLGLGTRMLDNIIRISRERGLESIYGMIPPDDRRSLEFTQKTGFATERINDGTLKARISL